MNKAQLALLVPEAGSHPQVPSVPMMQLAYEIVFAQDVIGTQLVPLVVQ